MKFTATIALLAVSVSSCAAFAPSTLGARQGEYNPNHKTTVFVGLDSQRGILCLGLSNGMLLNTFLFIVSQRPRSLLRRHPDLNLFSSPWRRQPPSLFSPKLPPPRSTAALARDLPRSSTRNRPRSTATSSLPTLSKRPSRASRGTPLPSPQ